MVARSVKLVVAVVLIFILFGSLLGIFPSIQKGQKTLEKRTLSLLVSSIPSNIIVATSDNERLKEIWMKMIDLSSSKPHKIAMMQLAQPLTENDMAYVEREISNSKINPTTITTLMGKCQLWLKVANPLSEEFYEKDPKILEMYYNSLSESTSVLKVHTISYTIKENLETFSSICGESGCPLAKKCGECANDIDEYKTLGNSKEAIDKELEIRKKECGEACASVCSGIYDGLSIIMSSKALDPEVRKTFISTGIRIV